MHQLLGLDLTQHSALPSGDLQNQLAVHVPVVRTLGIGYLCDDTLRGVLAGIAEPQSVLAHPERVALLIPEQRLGVVARRAVDTAVECLGDIHGKDIEDRLEGVDQRRDHPCHAVHDRHLRIVRKFCKFQTFVALGNGFLVYLSYGSAHRFLWLNRSLRRNAEEV